jgi:hypothetical protein
MSVFAAGCSISARQPGHKVLLPAYLSWAVYFLPHAGHLNAIIVYPSLEYLFRVRRTLGGTTSRANMARDVCHSRSRRDRVAGCA